MPTAAIDVYIAAFVTRCEPMRRSGRAMIDRPGVRGLLASSDDPRIRLLVTDDRAYDVLSALLADARAGMVNVVARAARCTELVDADPAWKPNQAMAMICRDLRTVPALALPTGLTLRPVRRLAGDAADGVALQDAVTSAMLGDGTIDDPPAVFARYLRALPSAMRLFVAVDGDGVVRATSGSGAFGAEASVIFVNTQPDWRGRGIGQAMTVAALRAAQEHGARRACLDASAAGLSIYRRLGFETVSSTTRFFRGRPTAVPGSSTSPATR
ncbi:MAG TPA: GNAT family N-acetyltransferase [Solirubrobacteraceae bacterium]